MRRWKTLVRKAKRGAKPRQLTRCSTASLQPRRPRGLPMTSLLVSSESALTWWARCGVRFLGARVIGDRICEGPPKAQEQLRLGNSP